MNDLTIVFCHFSDIFELMISFITQDVCMALFFRDKSSRVKNATLPPLCAVSQCYSMAVLRRVAM